MPLSSRSAVSSPSSYASVVLVYPPTPQIKQGLQAPGLNGTSRSLSRSTPLQPTRRSLTSLPTKESAITQRSRPPQKKSSVPEPCGDDVGQVVAAASVSPDSPAQQSQCSEARDVNTTRTAITRFSRTTSEDVQAHNFVGKHTPLVKRVLNVLKTEFHKEAHVSGPESELRRYSAFLRGVAAERLTILQVFVGVIQEEYLYLASLFHEWSPGLTRTPRLTYLADRKSLIIQMPSAIHEAPGSEFQALLTRFQQLERPRSLVRVHVTGSTDLEGDAISAIPDLTLLFSTLKNRRLRRNAFLLETAFSQTADSVFAKVEELVAARPDVLMVVVVLIDENTPYRSPTEGSPAWETLKRDVDPLELEDFMEMAELAQPELEESFTTPVVVFGHTWCCIDRVSYYVWLRQPGDNGANGVQIVIDPENIEQTEWSAHGVLPGEGEDMEHVRTVVNRGLELIRTFLIRFCEDAAARNGKVVNLAGLNQRITLPESWDHFSTAFLDARTATAYDRYMQWYKNCRGTKRSHSNDSYCVSGSEPDSEVTKSGYKRFAGER